MTNFQLRYTQLKNGFRNYFAEHRSLWYCVICVACLVCTIPVSMLVLSGYMNAADYMLEDAMYQHNDVDDSPVVFISVDTLDSEYDILSDIGSINAIITRLNSAEEKPAVIGLNFRLEFNSYGGVYKDFLETARSTNIVLGKTMSITGFTEISPEGTLEGVSDETLKMRDNCVYPNNVQNLCRQGYNNLYADRDGIVRHYLYDNKIVLGSDMDSFANQCYLAYCDYLGQQPVMADTNKSGFAMIRFSKPAGAYERYDLTDILMNKYDPADLAGKIVIIGYSDSYLEQEYITAPDHSVFVGNSEVQANAIYNLINGDSITELSIRLQLLFMTLIVAAVILITFTCRYYYALIAGAIAILADGLLSLYCWNYAMKAVHPFYILVSVIVVMFVGLIVNMQRARMNQVEVSDVLNRYMDTSVRKHILQKHLTGNIDVGAKRNVAVMFADIRNFTSVTEGMSPEEVVNMLNSYFTVADQCIHEYDGVLDKFVGDSVMAFWDDEENNGQAALKACKAALAISKGIMTVDDEQYRKYGREISFGIGISYGDAVLGDIGSKTRRTFTAIGHAANMASRLESLAPKGTIYISESVKHQLEGRIDAEKLDVSLMLRGSVDTVTVYSLNGLKSGITDIDKVVHLETAGSARYSMSILGCRGSYHVSGKRFVEFGGQTTCSVIKTGKHALVLDCGTGLYEAKSILADCTKIDVVLSHVHYDHCLGLLDWSIFPKDAELNFYGNFRGWLGLRTVNELFAAPFWPVDPVSGKHHQIPEWGKTLYLDDDISIRFFPSPHPNGAAIMYMTLGDKTICVMVDCERSDGMPFELVEGCDMLMYDGMYDDSEYASKQGWGHSTWQEGCRLASKAGVSRLLITHHNPVNTDSMLLERESFAQNIFPGTIFARSGMVIKF